MRRSIIVPLVALAGLIAPAHAGSIMGTFDGDSTLTPTGTPGVYIQNFSGDGMDTTYGAFTPSSTSTIDFSHPPHVKISNSMILETFSNGTLFGTGSGNGTANGKGTATFSVLFVITGGTGIFAGDTGEVTLHGTITQTSPTTEVISDGTYTGQLVPEPGSFALLAPAVALGAVVLVRQRRRNVIAR